jgi:uncharacterized OB-fold protein
VDPEDVYIGMEVEAVFKNAAERQGSILDVAHFRPVQEWGASCRPAGAG